MISEILERVKSGDILWIGESAPRGDMSNGAAAYDPRRDFRLQPTQHQAFDLVFLVERDLAKLKQWPLILDEALRAVCPGGVIVIRTSQSPLLSHFQLANFISRWTSDHFELLDIVDDGVTRILTIRLTHDQRRRTDIESFTFGLVTDGRKPANVAAFVDSVLAVDGFSANCEILLSGPRQVLADLGARAASVTLVEQPEQFLEKGWITRKKNQLVNAASQANIVIVHDRYVVPRTFLNDIKVFGGDFSVLAPRQTTLNGEPLPDWSMIADDLNWSTPGWMEHGDYHPWGFITGGVIVAKTDVLRTTPWNELLFWGQAEDVELTRRLSAVGVVQRLARHVSVLSEEPRPGFIEGYERLPWRDDVYSQTERTSFDGQSPSGPLGTAMHAAPTITAAQRFDLTCPSSIQIASDAGLILSRAWQETSQGVAWRETESPVISFKMRAPFIRGVVLEFKDEPDVGLLDKVTANSLPCEIIFISATKAYVSLPIAALTSSNIVHLSLGRLSGSDLFLRSITCADELAKRPYRFGETVNFGEEASHAYLTGGWHGQEQWGVWAQEAAATVSLPIASSPIGLVRGQASIQGFCPPGTDDQVITLRVGGHGLGKWRLGPETPAMNIQFDIPRRLLSPEILLEFRASRLTSPRDAGLGEDQRPLGVGLRTLCLSQAHN